MTTLSAFTVARPVDTRQSEPDETELWKDRADCRTWDFERQGDPWFEPIQGKKGRARYAPDIRAMCDACPVRALCLKDTLAREAKSDGPRFGFSGGMTPEERASIALLGVIA